MGWPSPVLRCADCAGDERKSVLPPPPAESGPPCRAHQHPVAAGCPQKEPVDHRQTHAHHVGRKALHTAEKGRVGGRSVSDMPHAPRCCPRWGVRPPELHFRQFSGLGLRARSLLVPLGRLKKPLHHPSGRNAEPIIHPRAAGASPPRLPEQRLGLRKLFNSPQITMVAESSVAKSLLRHAGCSSS